MYFSPSIIENVYERILKRENLSISSSPAISPGYPGMRSGSFKRDSLSYVPSYNLVIEASFDLLVGEEREREREKEKERDGESQWESFLCHPKVHAFYPRFTLTSYKPRVWGSKVLGPSSPGLFSISSSVHCTLTLGAVVLKHQRTVTPLFPFSLPSFFFTQNPIGIYLFHNISGLLRSTSPFASHYHHRRTLSHRRSDERTGSPVVPGIHIVRHTWCALWSSAPHPLLNSYAAIDKTRETTRKKRLLWNLEWSSSMPLR